MIRIDVSDDGDAKWTIESRFLLTNETEEAEFDEYAASVTSGQRDVSYDLQQFESFRRDAQEATGREMSLENAGWNEPRIVSPDEAGIEDADIPETSEDTEVRVGIISYSFTWTNFAVVEDDRIYFGDALVGLPSLTDGQRLAVHSPSNYALDTPTELVWDGPYEFSDGELEIVFVRTSGSGLPPVGWLVGGFALLLVVGAVSYLLARRSPNPDHPTSIDQLFDHGAYLAGSVADRLRSVTSQDQRASTKPNPDGGSVQSATDPAIDFEGADQSAADTGTQLEYEEDIDDDIDPDLLSDEERVLRMIKQNGGRMKQASIVSETGWSNAKVSQLLSQMDEDEDIEKLRIGRENLITLPEVDPTELD
ncbi:helix-turn-helix transcriptional regulator [Haloterrigena alkaliphila]|uniref:helix-turn-helix transcriptional regulator n=1 Tax=Haloterrigena alkaliphila TaxID=2816475 RepID=UPI0031F2E50C